MVGMPESRIHLIGAAGQVGRAVARLRPAGLVEYTSGEIDITDGASVGAALGGVTAGDVVLNCAAYTDVDAAESDRERAFAVNADGPGRLAAITAAAGARLIHLSTDYVFTPGSAVPQPFEPADLDLGSTPATVYGASKLAGERAALRADPRAVIVRTAWVFTGGIDDTDFVATMRRLERSREVVRVVDDQVGSPTYAPDLAAGLAELAAAIQAGRLPDGRVVHATNAGSATWYDLARGVFAGVGADPGRVQPCTTAEFPRPAPRPAYSVLSGASWATAGLTPLRPWETALAAALA